MRCSKCGTEGIVGKKFCAECGSPLSNRCTKCNSDNPVGAKFCADCGNALSEGLGTEAGGIRIAAEQQTSDAIEGERKTVTALFADIKGSTELMEDLDPEEARAIIDPALKIMVEAVRRYEGYVVQSTGDGIFALFGAPLAHEDHPQRALYAALLEPDRGELCATAPFFEPLKTNQSMISERRRPPASKTRLSLPLKVEALALDTSPLTSSCWTPEQSPKKTSTSSSASPRHHRHHRLLE
jgi:Adenylate and Guanylate cyclase catalytic domain/Double zinc ribbon